MADSIDRKKIEQRAYQIFEERGRTHGWDIDDWIRAEREIKSLEKNKKPLGRKKTFL
ncbi:MAG TPA: DUF2934 domain-containing protein [Chitinivibrionales bacterium]|nr:DUF2934 domain-containing protein [Chitinivibrionales bacterium]